MTTHTWYPFYQSTIPLKSGRDHGDLIDDNSSKTVEDRSSALFKVKESVNKSPARMGCNAIFRNPTQPNDNKTVN
jgi:hypothetical protein